MKIKTEHYNILKEKIETAMKEKPNALTEYLNAGLSTMRYRWDIARYSFHGEFDQFICRELYSYCNDTHIDSALRKITGTK